MCVGVSSLSLPLPLPLSLSLRVCLSMHACVSSRVFAHTAAPFHELNLWLTRVVEECRVLERRAPIVRLPGSPLTALESVGCNILGETNLTKRTARMSGAETRRGGSPYCRKRIAFSRRDWGYCVQGQVFVRKHRTPRRILGRRHDK